MDFLMEESREDRLIDDYLFNGYRPGSKSSFDKDQQFAKPIADEDIFGIEARDELALANGGELNGFQDSLSKTNNTNDPTIDFDRSCPFGGIENDLLCDEDNSSPGQIFDDEVVEMPSSTQNQPPRINIDDIFIDDYSQSSDQNLSKTYSNENVCPDKSYSRAKPPPPPSPAQVKMMRMKEKFRLQALALGIKPNFASGFDKDGTVEVVLDQDKLVSDSSSKFIFNKLTSKSRAAERTPKRHTRNWMSLSDSIRKKICTRKREVWESFQAPADGFDDEEELVKDLDSKSEKEDEFDELEKELDGSLEKESDEDSDDDVVRRRPIAKDNGDGNFEDLEKEDVRSDADVESDADGVASNADDEQSEIESVAGDQSDVSSHGEVHPECHSVSRDCESEPEAETALNDQDNSGLVESDEEVSAEEDSVDEDSDVEIQFNKKRSRAIFIDDEASED